jgi:hypothetical protein
LENLKAKKSLARIRQNGRIMLEGSYGTRLQGHRLYLPVLGCYDTNYENTVFYDMMPYRLAEIHRNFGGT